MATWTDYLWLAGAGVVGLSLLETAWMGVDYLRRSRRGDVQRRLELELLEQRIASARKRRIAEEQTVLHWGGWRKFEVKRKVCEDLKSEVYSLYLHPHDGKAIPDFMPGQYLTLRLNVPGNDRQIVRCYSLSDCHRGDHYRLTIKRALPPSDKPEMPKGVASCFLCECLPEGAILDVQAPKGAFYLDTRKETPIVLIGGGIGITPMVSMMNSVITAGGNREIWLFYGLRNRAEHIWKEELEQVAREHPNVKLHVCYSQPSEQDIEGKDYQHKGRVSIELMKQVLPSSNFEFYMCGPPTMMTSMVEGLAAWGVPEEHVHLETFGPSSRKKEKKAPGSVAATAGGPEVVFRRSGKTAQWDAQYEHIWELAEASEVKIDAGCLEGNCGSCVIAIVEGEVEYTKKPGFTCEAGTCLACCSVPKGRIELDA